MTKADIINEISRATGMEKAAVSLVVEKFMETIKDSLASGNNVALRGFGSFIAKTRKEKIARNINRQTTVIVPSRRVPTFKASRLFVEDLN